MKILEAILDFPQGSWGEDRMVVTESCCAVIDGATPVKKFAFKGYNSNAEWMSDQLAKYITKNYTPDMDFIDICEDFIKATKDKYYINKKDAKDKTMMPSVTTAAVTENNRVVKIRTMCDSAAYVLFKDGSIKKYTDHRVDKYSKKTLKIKAMAKEAEFDILPLLMKQRRKNKEKMNVKDGYWVVTYVGNFREEFFIADFNMKDVSKVLICTDGFDRVLDIIPNPLSVNDIFEQRISLEKALKYLRESENKMSSESQWQNKLHDDVTAILIDFNLD